MLLELLAEVQHEADLRNWEVAIKVIIVLMRPKKKLKPGRSKRHRRRLLVNHPFCAYCGIGLDLEDSTIDHVKPVCKGGTWDKKNLVLACEKCNRKKGSKYP